MKTLADVQDWISAAVAPFLGKPSHKAKMAAQDALDSIFRQFVAEGVDIKDDFGRKGYRFIFDFSNETGVATVGMLTHPDILFEDQGKMDAFFEASLEK